MNEMVIPEQETALEVREVTEMAPIANMGAKTMWNDTELMKASFQVANILARTSAMPDKYKGKPGDCLILIDLSNRMGVSPIAIAQWSQVIKGNFTWSGQACKALIDGCGKYEKSEYVMSGDGNKDERSCQLVAIRKDTGAKIAGPVVSIKMAKDEGWYDKPGSKWQTMPELMLRYRAAAFFARTECPEVLMGFYSSEEMQDIKGYEEDK